MANPRGRKDEEGAFAPTDSYKRMSVDLEWILLENSTKPTPFATDTSAPSSDKGRFSLQADNKEAAHAKSELRVEEKGKKPKRYIEGRSKIVKFLLQLRRG